MSGGTPPKGVRMKREKDSGAGHRLFRRLVAPWLVMAACAPAAPSMTDASSEASVGACGLPSRGVCEGQTYRFCEGDEQVMLDCASTGGRCTALAGGEFVSCQQPVGASCRTVVPHGSHSHLLFQFCEGSGSGCLQDREGGRCVADLGACTMADIDTCRGARLITNCRVGQAIAIDCDAIGARCEAGARACVGVPLGAPCDRVRRRCVDGARCQMNRGDITGTCVVDLGDAGTDASGGTDASAGTDASGGG